MLLGMIARPRHLVADEFGGDEVGNFRAPALPVAVLRDLLAAQIFALCDIFHLGGDDTAPRIVHLADVLAGLGPKRPLHDVGELRNAARTVRPELAVILRLHFSRVVFLDIAPCEDQVATQRRQPRVDVDGRHRIGIGAGSIVDAQAGLAAFEVDLAHRDPHAAARSRGDMHLAAATDGPGGDANLYGGIQVGHAHTLHIYGARADFAFRAAPSLRPYYRDQVRRVAAYSALNLRLRDRLPGDGACVEPYARLRKSLREIGFIATCESAPTAH